MSGNCEARGPRGWHRRTDWSLVGQRVGLLLLASGMVRAAESSSSAPASNPPAADVSIEAAKRDFEAIKAARNPAEQPRAELPRVTLPDISATPTPFQSSRQPTEATDPKAKKSKGWLVDAMEDARKEAARKAASDRKDGTSRDGFADRTGDESSLAGERSPGRENETKSEAAAAEKPKPAVKDNPLTQYMAAWMTPQDYSLLRPVVDAAAPGGDSGSRTSNSVGTSGGASPDLGATAEIMTQIATTAKPAAPIAPAENPFLATINLPVPTSTPVPAAAIAPPPSVFSAPPPPPATPPPSLPDLVKKSSDDKYYKPLKRF